MKFEIDKQTLHDIDLFDSNRNENSIFNILNSTKSIGGRQRLLDYLNSPSANLNEIKNRRDAIKFFANLDCVSSIDIDRITLDFIEHYLTQVNYPTKPPSKFRAVERALQNRLNPTNEYYIVERGVDYIIDMLNRLYLFSKEIHGDGCPSLIQKNNTEIARVLESSEFSKIRKIKEMQKLKATDIAFFDYMFRYSHKDIVRFFLDIIYDYDVFITVSQVAIKYGFSYPDILPKEESVIDIKGLFHPFLKKPVKNDICFSPKNNLLFLTGSNMSGKSSLLKALSVSVYLAHVGFPIPATSAKISVQSGLYTTINLSDNLSLGHSYFFSEVSRIKFIAERLHRNTNLLIVFDELFKGTNIKDASEGSLAIISAFSRIKNCFFVVSSHIFEVAHSLINETSIIFRRLEVINDNEYTYLLKEGISDDRMGMYIINKENIISILETAISKK